MIRANDDETGPVFLGIGSAHAVADAEGVTGKPRGRVLVPDHDSRGGWREYYVWPDRPKENGRPIEFGRGR